MRFRGQTHLFLTILTVFVLLFSLSCRTRSTDNITIALSEKFSGLDTLSNTGTDAAADRVRNLMFNSLVKKNENFEYVGELGDYQIGADNLTVTFTLKDNVKFHNGKTMTSADAKYTFDALFQANGTKAGSFFDSAPDPANPGKTKRVPHISSIETPNDKTIVFKVTRPALVNQLLSNLVTIPIIPEGTIEQQKTSPVGSGPFKFVSFDQVNSIVELEGNPDYWEGAPQIQKLTVRTVPDANALQAELQSGRVDLAPLPINLSPDTLKALDQSPNLNVQQFPGSNIQYIGFNTQVAPFDNVKVRQAVAYGIDRNRIINELLAGQAQIAHSILPEESWAFFPGTTYSYDPARARQLLQEAGYRGEVVKFKFSAGNKAVNDYAQVIQNSLKDVGFNVELETIDFNTLLSQLTQGQFQMTTARWVGGNQDPIFLRDLFASSDFPDRKEGGRNRSRYSNQEFDRIIEEAVNTTDKSRAKELYARAQQIISNDVPLFPLWYPSNMVISSDRVGNVKINASGDWSFVKDVTVQK